MDDAQLQTIWQQRRFTSGLTHLGQPLAFFMKHNLGKRVSQLSRLAEVWDEVIPEDISEHTALESYRRGVLTVLVDSAAHRYQLRMLLDGGSKKAIQQRFTGPIDRIRLVPGQFYAVDLVGAQRYQL